jgi:DNA repair protein RecN (Recombination protein N)
VVGAALKLRTARANAALELEKRIIAELRDLFLPRAVFKVRLTETREPTESGMDHIEFHVSVNPGQPTLAISKVASGGEISRLMLALKVIFNRLYGVTTTIFDEVDTGVSGEIASAIGRKMQSLATSGQVIAITHLPQVAASAPHHLHVVKEMSEQSTTTNVRLLQPSERIEVIAKMLSGTTITSAARQTAEQLLTTSHEFSKNR